MGQEIKIGFAPKTVDLNDGTKLHFWYANNKGRGGDNCTIVRSTDQRSSVSANQTGVITSVRTSAWAGKVNFSKDVQKALGL